MKPLEILAIRHRREQWRRDRNAAIRATIHAKMPRAWVMLEYGASATAYAQIAGQDRAA